MIIHKTYQNMGLEINVTDCRCITPRQTHFMQIKIDKN